MVKSLAIKSVSRLNEKLRCSYYYLIGKRFSNQDTIKHPKKKRTKKKRLALGLTLASIILSTTLCTPYFGHKDYGTWDQSKPISNLESIVALNINDETSVAHALSPVFVFSKGEPEENPLIVYQVSPNKNRDKLAVVFTSLYRNDYGAFAATFSLDDLVSYRLSRTVLKFIGAIDAHDGDAEVVRFFLEKIDTSETNLDDTQLSSLGEGYALWRITSISIKQHTRWKHYSPSAFGVYDSDAISSGEKLGLHFIFYVSRGKHATYPLPRECNQSTVTHFGIIELRGDECNIGEPYWPPIWPEANFGEPGDLNTLFNHKNFIERFGEKVVYEGPDKHSSWCGGKREGPDDIRVCQAKWYLWNW